MSLEPLGRELANSGMCFQHFLCFALAWRVVLETAGWFRDSKRIRLLGVFLLGAPALIALEPLFFPRPYDRDDFFEVHFASIRLCTTVALLTIAARLLLHRVITYGPRWFDVDSVVWRIVRHPGEFPGRYPCRRRPRRKNTSVRPPVDPFAACRVTDPSKADRGEQD